MKYLVRHNFVADRLYRPGEIIELDPAAADGANAVQPGLLVPADDAGNPAEVSVPVIDIDFGDADIYLDICTEDAFMPPFRGEKHLLDLPMMLQVAQYLRPSHILEIGTAYGNSAYNLACFCPEAKIVTVNPDAQETRGRNITFRLEREEIGRVFRSHPDESANITQVYSDSKLLTKKMTGLKSAELVIIDGCHDFDYVISDFAFALRMLPSTNSVILLHDALRYGVAPEVHDAILHLREKGHDIRLIEGTSWAMYTGDFMASPWDEVVTEVP